MAIAFKGQSLIFPNSCTFVIISQSKPNNEILVWASLIWMTFSIKSCQWKSFIIWNAVTTIQVFFCTSSEGLTSSLFRICREESNKASSNSSCVVWELSFWTISLHGLTKPLPLLLRYFFFTKFSFVHVLLWTRHVSAHRMKSTFRHMKLTNTFLNLHWYVT